MSGSREASAHQLSLIPRADGARRHHRVPPLDDATREIGRRGLAQARAALHRGANPSPARAA